MKRVFTLLSIVAIAAIFMTACNQNSKTASEKVLTYEDTVGLAQFQAWKVQNERVDPIYASAPAAAPVRKAATRTRSSASKSGTMTSTSTNQAKTTAKKGWSKSAKYAVIGGVAGGAAGAIINKRNRVVGGVVGAVIGAGGGYIFGRSQDKKDGRL
jgi:hypothetical protein